MNATRIKRKQAKYQLEKYVKEHWILLQKENRKPLINLINETLCFYGHQWQSIEKLNAILQEHKLPYKIEQFETTQLVTNSNGEIEEQLFKEAWRVVKVKNRISLPLLGKCR